MRADPVPVAAWIRNGRSRLGLSQTALSRLTSIGRARLYEAGAGRLALDAEEVQRLATVFGEPAPDGPAP